MSSARLYQLLPGKQPIFNIILIPAIGLDVKESWRCSSGSNDFWPARLGDDIDNIDIWAIDYGGDEESWLNGKLPFEVFSKDFLDSVIVSDLCDKPLIVFASGSGGLIIKKIFDLHSYKPSDDSKEFVNCCNAVVFSGVPHKKEVVKLWLDRIFPYGDEFFVERERINISDVIENFNQIFGMFESRFSVLNANDDDKPLEEYSKVYDGLDGEGVNGICIGNNSKQYDEIELFVNEQMINHTICNDLVEAKESVRIFISYARNDSEFFMEFYTALIALERQYGDEISIWYDEFIETGQPWREEIFSNLEGADIVICLISSNFIASDFCYKKEFSYALESFSEKIVLPVKITPCFWDKLPISDLQAMPKKWISDYTDGERYGAWRDVVKAIDQKVEGILEEKRVERISLKVKHIDAAILNLKRNYKSNYKDFCAWLVDNRKGLADSVFDRVKTKFHDTRIDAVFPIRPSEEKKFKNHISLFIRLVETSLFQEDKTLLNESLSEKFNFDPKLYKISMELVVMGISNDFPARTRREFGRYVKYFISNNFE